MHNQNTSACCQLSALGQAKGNSSERCMCIGMRKYKARHSITNVLRVLVGTTAEEIFKSSQFLCQIFS